MTVSILRGHVLDVLRTLPSDHFQTVATSPPYYGLRDYGLEPQTWGGDLEHVHKWGSEIRAPWANSVPGPSTNHPKNGAASHWTPKVSGAFCACGAWLGSLGLEPTPELYVEHLTSVFREVRRVLRPDGIAWVNLGDSYAGSGKGPSNSIQPKASQLGAGEPISCVYECEDCGITRNISELTSGCPQCGQTMTPLPMRPAQTGEHAASCQANHPGEPPWPCTCGLFPAKRRNPGQFANGQAPTSWLSVPSGCKPKDLLGIPWMVAFALRADGWYLRADIIWSKPNPMPESVADRPTKAHEYVFLISKSRTYYYDADSIREPQVDFERGANGQRVQLVDERPGPGVRSRTLNEMDRNGNQRAYNPAGRNRRSVWEIATAPFPEAHFATFPPKLVEPMILAGSRPGDHVLDPFCGAGTTLLVADRLDRNATGIDLNPTYANMAADRIRGDAPLFTEVVA